MILSPPPLQPPIHAPTRHHIHRPPTTTLTRKPNLKQPRTTTHATALTREVDTFTESSGYLFELSSTEAESLTDYNISKIASIYRNKPFIVLRRLLQISNTLGKWLVLRYIDSLSERSDTMFKVKT